MISEFRKKNTGLSQHEMDAALLDALKNYDPLDQGGSLAEMIYLLESGANPNATNEEGLTALQVALQNMCPGLAVCLMITKGANVHVIYEGETPLITTVKNYHFAHQSHMVNTLLEHGAEVNAKDSSGHTALYYVLNQQSLTTAHILTARILLSHKASTEEVGHIMIKTPMLAGYIPFVL